MRSLSLSLLLLCTLCALVSVHAEVQAVKMCGREFIRAVVYTCGGSRWRRILDELEPDGTNRKDQDTQEALNYSPEVTLAQRDLNKMLTTVCCQMGCRKSDLSFLC